MSPLSLLLNIAWILFGGLWMAAGWVLAAVIMAITIIGLPWARAAFNIAAYTLLPFGQRAVPRDTLTNRSDIGTGPLGFLRQSDLARVGRLVAGARPSDHRSPMGHYNRRHPVRLGASETCRHRTVADRQGNRAGVIAGQLTWLKKRWIIHEAAGPGGLSVR